ncbi:MAG: DUF58 domain-containing protein, partial [Actinobacteria bacterium]|nr:DUF58 domain-containing protein [Actinomycetota bacterium]
GPHHLPVPGIPGGHRSPSGGGRRPACHPGASNGHAGRCSASHRASRRADGTDAGRSLLELRCAAPLGLVWWTRRLRLPLARPLEVAPSPTPMSVPSISQGEGGDRHRPERRSGHDSVRTVRDYVPGDATRLVHWAVTARRDQLTVKELEDPEGAVLAVVLDLSGDPELGEKMASRAAGLCAAGLRGGLEVVLCTAEDKGPVTGRVSSPTAAGRRLARAVPGPPGRPAGSARAVHLP